MLQYYGYRTPGCPVPNSPTALLNGQSGGQSVSRTLTPRSSGVLHGWLLSSLLVLLTSLSCTILLRLHCRKSRPALVPLHSAPLTRPSRSRWRRMETPSTLLGVHWLVPPLTLSRLLGLTTRIPSIPRPPIFCFVYFFASSLFFFVLRVGGLRRASSIPGTLPPSDLASWTLQLQRQPSWPAASPSSVFLDFSY